MTGFWNDLCSGWRGAGREFASAPLAWLLLIAAVVVTALAS